MDERFLRLPSIILLAILVGSACSPKAATPAADAMATAVAQAASLLMTQTALAAPPTSSPTATLPPSPTNPPLPAVTSTPIYTNPLILNTAGCYFGPGPSYTLESNISKGKRVELLGVGSVSGWYVIRNPYFHRPCWIEAANLKIYEGINTTDLRMMTPGVPLAGQ